MRIAFIGLGKLGLPCALAMADAGHTVVGYDASVAVRQAFRERRCLFTHEPDVPALLQTTTLTMADSVAEAVRGAEIVFVAVQTPHAPMYEGTTRLPKQRADFDYGYLEAAVREIANHVGPETVVAVISTVLPGTMSSRIAPLMRHADRLVYNPFFIAMGTCIYDLRTPEFVLLGGGSGAARRRLRDFYCPLTNCALVVECNFATAELIKVAYNTFIGQKLVFANTLMEISEKIGADIDAVTGALCLADNRLISGRYLHGGMGDGGACHGRDQIAMSWLAQRLKLSTDLFEATMVARERQTEWLVELIQKEQATTGLPVIVLGMAYKPETNLTTGSAAVLLSALLDERGMSHASYDPFCCESAPPLNQPAVFCIATRHAVFADYQFPTGSVVIDPWRYIPSQNGVRIRALGKP